MLKELHSIYPVYGENYDDIVGVVNFEKTSSLILKMTVSTCPKS